jgi:hypothetical protein
MWVGGSFWWQRNSNLGGPVTPNTGGSAQNDLAAMTTQGGVSFFSSSYGNGKDLGGNTVRSHLVPWGDTTKWAVEANVPWQRIGLRFEMVGQTLDIAQYNDTNPAAASLARTAGKRGATLDGLGYYVELYGWILGDVGFLETPGLEAAPRIKRFAAAREPRWGLQLLAKYEHIGFDVKGLPQGAPDAMGNPTKDPAEGSYELHAFELGVNAWATKHVRVTANYVLNYMDGDAANMKKNFYYQKYEHELLFRLGIAL